MTNFFTKLSKGVGTRYFGAASKASTMGLHMISGPAVGALMGFFLDKWLGTKPWLLIFFVISGVGAGFKNVYLDAKRLLEVQEKKENAADSSTPKD